MYLFQKRKCGLPQFITSNTGCLSYHQVQMSAGHLELPALRYLLMASSDAGRSYIVLTSEISVESIDPAFNQSLIHDLQHRVVDH